MADSVGGGGAGGGGAPAATKPAAGKPKAQATLYQMAGKEPPLPKPVFTADGALAGEHNEAVALARGVVAAAAKIKQPSPKPVVPGFIDDSEKCECILVKGSKKTVEVYRITLPPLSYWLELGKVKQFPTVRPPYVSLGFTYVRKDGIAAREQGDFDLVCANFFEG